MALYLGNNKVSMSSVLEGIAATSGSPIIDENLENTTQYRQMNATVGAFIANVDYTKDAND